MNFIYILEQGAKQWLSKDGNPFLLKPLKNLAKVLLKLFNSFTNISYSNLKIWSLLYKSLVNFIQLPSMYNVENFNIISEGNGAYISKFGNISSIF